MCLLGAVVAEVGVVAVEVVETVADRQIKCNQALEKDIFCK